MRRFVIGAVLHDHQDVVAVLERRDILYWIAIDHDEVGEIAFLHQAELVPHTHDLAAIFGGRHDSFNAICRMVENGVGLAVIPETGARRSRRSMAIRVSHLLDPWTLRQPSICVRRLEQLPAQARQLVQHLRRLAPRGQTATS